MVIVRGLCGHLLLLRLHGTELQLGCHNCVHGGPILAILCLGVLEDILGQQLGPFQLAFILAWLLLSLLLVVSATLFLLVPALQNIAQHGGPVNLLFLHFLWVTFGTWMLAICLLLG